MKAHDLDQVKYSILSDRLNVPNVVAQIMEYIEKKTNSMGCPCLFDIKVVLNELISNAVIHGNKEDASRPVDITVDYSENKIAFEITDRGLAFTPQNREDLGIMCETGRGVSICTMLCKKLEYYYKDGIGNSARAVFYITEIKEDEK